MSLGCIKGHSFSSLHTPLVHFLNLLVYNQILALEHVDPFSWIFGQILAKLLKVLFWSISSSKLVFFVQALQDFWIFWIFANLLRVLVEFSCINP